MAVQDVTLETLLELALGTPEIGAVNFNFLHEVIHEILKHLGISKKPARVTQELDYRLRDIGYFGKASNDTDEIDTDPALIDEHSAPQSPVDVPATASPTKYGEPSKQPSLESVSIKSKTPDILVQSQKEEVVASRNTERDKTPSPSLSPRSAKSRKSSVQIKKSFLSQHRLSQMYHTNEGSIKDVAIVKNMERSESKTPAGDMWHVMNINRRVEAAEAAIQGITTLIDTMNCELDDLKNNNKSPEPNSYDDLLEKMNAMFKSYDEKFKDMEGMIAEMALKLDQIPEMPEINETTKEDFAPPPSSESPPSSETALKKLDSRGSRTRVALQEVSDKMLYLQQEIIKVKEHIGKLENELNKKLDLTAIESKADKSELTFEVDALREEIRALDSHLNTLEDLYKAVCKDVSALIAQYEEFEAQQKALAKAVRRLDRNLEDMNDNRNGSDIQPNVVQTNNMVDEAALTKIRGTIFDMQEQQSKFQNQIDILLQDSKNKDKSLEEIFADIRSLEERKVDEAFVKKELECKVDRSAIANKVNRDQFDACIGEIDLNIQALLQKVEGMEAFANKSIEEMQLSIVEKIDRSELKKLQAYFDSRFKSLKPTTEEKRQTEENAAGSRKQLLKNCNCISCDRPVEIPLSNNGTTLPCYEALPGAKSIRPVNTFDLQTIRRHNVQQQFMHSNNKHRFEVSHERDKLQKELLQLCGVRDLDELAAHTNRACGGEHTLIEQHQRNPTNLLCRERNIPIKKSDCTLYETEVRGRDGHIYKGRQSPVLPAIQRKGNNDDSLSPPNSAETAVYPSSIEPENSGSMQKKNVRRYKIDEDDYNVIS